MGLGNGGIRLSLCRRWNHKKLSQSLVGNSSHSRVLACHETLSKLFWLLSTGENYSNLSLNKRCLSRFCRRIGSAYNGPNAAGHMNSSRRGRPRRLEKEDQTEQNQKWRGSRKVITAFLRLPAVKILCVENFLFLVHNITSTRWRYNRIIFPCIDFLRQKQQTKRRVFSQATSVITVHQRRFCWLLSVQTYPNLFFRSSRFHVFSFVKLSNVRIPHVSRFEPEQWNKQGSLLVWFKSAYKPMDAKSFSTVYPLGTSRQTNTITLLPPFTRLQVTVSMHRLRRKEQ